MAGGSPAQEENELGCLGFDAGRNGGAISGSMTFSGFNVFLVMSVWQDDHEEEGEEECEGNIYDKNKQTKKNRRRRRRTTGTGSEAKLYWLPLFLFQARQFLLWTRQSYVLYLGIRKTCKW